MTHKKVAPRAFIIGNARPLLRQSGVRQSLKAHRGHTRRYTIITQLVMIFFGKIPGGINATVLLPHQLRRIRGEARGLRHRPAGCFRFETSQPAAHGLVQRLAPLRRLVARRHRCGRRRRLRNTEAHPSHRMPPALNLLQRHHQPGSTRMHDRTPEAKHGRLRLVQGGIGIMDRPAGVRPAIHGLRHGKSRLGSTRFSRRDGHSHRSRRPVQRLRRHADFTEDKIAMRRAPRSLSRQRRIRHRFQPKRAHLGRPHLHRQRDRFLIRTGRRKKHRLIGLHRRHLTTRRHHRHRTDRLPLEIRHRQRPMQRKLRRQLFHFRRTLPLLLHRQQAAQIMARLLHVVEKGHDLKILGVLQRIIFVRMALRTAQREPHPRRAGGPHPVGHGAKTKFQRINSSLLVEHGITMKSGRHQIILPAIRKHITRQLSHRKLVKGHVLVQRPDDPVAPWPHRSRPVFFIPVGVGIPRHIQPAARPAFTVPRRSQ